MSFTLQLSQTWRRASAQRDSILYVGRTADQRSRHRGFNKGRVHSSHPKSLQVHFRAWIFIPLYPVNSSHIVQPRYDINFVVSFRHIGISSLYICEYNTGTVCSINKVTYWMSTYHKTMKESYRSNRKYVIFLIS